MEFIARLARGRAAPGHLPFFRIEQSRDRAQQCGLARAVLARQQHALTRACLEAHAAQHVPIAAPQVQARDVQHAMEIEIGAPGRTRTGMALRPTDFKSVASTSFATRAEDMEARVGIEPA